MAHIRIEKNGRVRLRGINPENTMHVGESLIYDAVKDMTKDALEQTVRKNAAAKNFDLNDEHLNVIRSLFVHYKQDCKTRDCLAAHEHMRFLEEAYEFRLFVETCG